MKLDAPFVQLPMVYDAQLLADEISAIDASAWRPHPQGFAGNTMLPLVAVDGDPANQSFNGPMLPTPELKRCAYLQQVIASFGATVGRTRLMRLSGGAEVTPHVDQGYYWSDRVRVHVPIITQPGVRFECGEEALNMREGECWIFDTWRLHRVLNDDDRSRIHLVCDTVGGADFWNLVAAGKPVGRGSQSPGWQPQRIAFREGMEYPIRFESHNVPAVMSPWEIKHRLDFLVGEMRPSPAVVVVREQVESFFLAWRALWAQYADSPQGVPEYRQLLDRFMYRIQPVASTSVLQNDLPLMSVLVIMVASAAVVGNEASAAINSLAPKAKPSSGATNTGVM